MVDPGAVSDHKTLIGNLTLPGATPTGGPTPTT
jgi:hypothetical protein